MLLYLTKGKLAHLNLITKAETKGGSCAARHWINGLTLQLEVHTLSAHCMESAVAESPVGYIIAAVHNRQEPDFHEQPTPIRYSIASEGGQLRNQNTK